jgi:hypothetical protein
MKTYRQTARQTARHDRQADRQKIDRTDRKQADRQAGMKTSRQTARQTDRHDRQADRQTGRRRTNRQKITHYYRKRPRTNTNQRPQQWMLSIVPLRYLNFNQKFVKIF